MIGMCFLGKQKCLKKLSECLQYSDLHTHTHTYLHMDSVTSIHAKHLLKEIKSLCLIKSHPNIETSMLLSQSDILGRIWCLSCTHSLASWPHLPTILARKSIVQLMPYIAVSWPKKSLPGINHVDQLSQWSTSYQDVCKRMF